MEKISDRINEIIKNEEITIRAFEQKIGCSNGLISKFIKNGQSLDSDKFTDINGRWLSLIIETFPKYNSLWLLTGNGSMLIGANSSSPPEIKEDIENVPPGDCEKCKLKDTIIANQEREIATQREFIELLKEASPQSSGQKRKVG